MARSGRSSLCARRRRALVGVLVAALVASVGGFTLRQPTAHATTTSLAPCAAPVVPNAQEGIQYQPNSIDAKFGQMSVWPAQTGSGPRPLVLIIQGSGFAAVTPVVPNLDSPLDCAARFLATAGFVVAAPGYDAADGSWPTRGLLDMQHAVQWLREPAQLAAFNVDSTRVGALGTSAGGLLAGLLGSDAADPSYHVQAVVTWSGPLDLTDVPIEAPSVVLTPPTNVLTEVYEIQQDLLGCQPYVPAAQPADSWEAVPSCLNGPASEASPYKQVGPNTAPILMANARYEGVLLGTGSCVPSGSFAPSASGCFGIPVGEPTAMFAKTQEAGIPSKLDEISDDTIVGGSGGCAGPAPLSTMHVEYAWCAQQVWDDTAAWFARYLEPESGPGPPPAPPLEPGPTNIIEVTPTLTG